MFLCLAEHIAVIGTRFSYRIERKCGWSEVDGGRDRGTDRKCRFLLIVLKYLAVAVQLGRRPKIRAKPFMNAVKSALGGATEYFNTFKGSSVVCVILQ